uniref:DUF4939 domain-containing protein n=1 Tax=Varanus komodoensis TaxID=61221 RepID=A0A8D2J4Y4_VARKO
MFWLPDLATCSVSDVLWLRFEDTGLIRIRQSCTCECCKQKNVSPTGGNQSCQNGNSRGKLYTKGVHPHLCSHICRYTILISIQPKRMGTQEPFSHSSVCTMNVCMAGIATRGSDPDLGVIIAVSEKTSARITVLKQLSNAHAALQTTRPAPALAPTTAPQRQSPVEPPVKFVGDQEKLPIFHTQAELYMKWRPEDFPNNQVSVIIRLLTGSVGKWAAAHLLAEDPLLVNNLAFTAAMSEFLGDAYEWKLPPRKSSASKQGRESAEDYKSCFQPLMRLAKLCFFFKVSLQGIRKVHLPSIGPQFPAFPSQHVSLRNAGN